ncbi:WxL domain-containing protein [Vagococcus sp. BWB3-3]|uniref:WxL domain-containing protein n=1 Tax=Vagococcus allomyrinae TaxID=2794353 RepID=A0A940P7G7_9ENTE|nr:WxL domain-containing protein [Vagococcus allomyrinae]MBP1039460.1 WxL domain-containing protein [Vagococcus allomyrinae]
MKMKKIMTTTVLSVLALGLMAPAALAESATTKGKVQFINDPDGDKPTPVDPTKPTPEPIIVDPERPGTEGYLRFDRVPQFDFGQVKLTNAAVDAPVLQDEFKTSATDVFYAAPTVEVTDRRGSNAGWTTSVKAGPFELVKAGDENKLVPEIEAGNDLVGAVISIGEGHANVHSKDGSVTNASAPDVFGTFELNDKDYIFASAKKDKGMGQWSIAFHEGDAQTTGDIGYPNKHTTQGNEESIRLSVPESSKKLVDRTYRSVVTWTISDEPGK